jgi:hypothetical protein
MKNVWIVLGTGLSLTTGIGAAFNQAMPITSVPLEASGPLISGEASTVKGVAEFSVLSDGMTKVVLSVENLVAGGRHAAHLHKGTCENQGGLVVGLPDLVADKDGKATVEKVYQTGALPKTAYVNVHQQGTYDGIGGSISCGAIK